MKLPKEKEMRNGNIIVGLHSYTQSSMKEDMRTSKRERKKGLMLPLKKTDRENLKEGSDVYQLKITWLPVMDIFTFV